MIRMSLKDVEQLVVELQTRIVELEKYRRSKEYNSISAKIKRFTNWLLFDTK